MDKIKNSSRYKDKSPDDIRCLFADAFTWENYREEFPQWKSKQEKAASEKEKERAIEAVRKNPPLKCECGGVLEKRYDDMICMADGCYNRYEVEKNLVKWVLKK